MSNVPPTYQRPRSNGLGLAGFIVSLVAILTFGLLSPIGLLLSFLGLFRRPRGLAFAGFLLGFLGTAFIGIIFFFFGWLILSVVRFGKPMVDTAIAGEKIKQVMQSYYSSRGTLPDDAAGNVAIDGYRDGWGRPFAYHRIADYSFQLRSASKDGVFMTEDDFVDNFDMTR